MLWIPILIAAIIVIAVIAGKNHDLTGTVFEPPERREGRRGEQAAADMIKSVLREDDLLFTNVEISYDDKPAELDNVIINKYGVFIIEVKSYKGRLLGDEDDYEWEKYHTTDAGNTYSKIVKNPIRQVKRQVYLLAHYLDYYGTRVWVTGYAFLLYGNSPVKSEYILSNADDIDRAIHTPGKNRITKQTLDSIKKLLE